MVEARRGRKGSVESRVPTEQDRLIATYCIGCTVRETCLAESLIDQDEYGIWGGLAKQERAPLLREYRKTGVVPQEMWETTHEFTEGYDAESVRDYFALQSEGASASRPTRSRKTSQKTPTTKVTPPAALAAASPPTPEPKPGVAPSSITPIDHRREYEGLSLVELKGQLALKQSALEALIQYAPDAIAERAKIKAKIAAIRVAIADAAQAS